MKAILISIKPKWVAKILNGEKTIEIRKTMPKCELPIDVYIYCTKDNHQLVKPKGFNKHLLFTKGAVDYSHEHTLNGKVVAKFTLNKVEEIINYGLARRSEIMMKELLEKSCLTMEELNKYAPHKEYDNNDYIYAWHIDNLVIFDEPKELGEFNALQRAKATDCGYLKQCKNCGKRFNRCHLLKPLTKAPQSYMFIEID